MRAILARERRPIAAGILGLATQLLDRLLVAAADGGRIADYLANVHADHLTQNVSAARHLLR